MPPILSLASSCKTVENSGIKVEQKDLSLGELQGVFHVKLGLGYLVPHIALLAVALLGLAIYLGADPGWKTYVSAVAFALLTAPFLFALWKTVPTWMDELSVYEKGFVYKNRSGLSSCAWGQIKDSGGVLDAGNRLKITSVEKRDGEKIAFAYKMRGLDLLDHLYAEYEFDKIPDSEKATLADLSAEPKTLGTLKHAYYVKMGFLDYIPLVMLFFLAVFGVMIYATSKDILALFVCSLPLVLIFALVLRSTFGDRRDVLTIYENGFTYSDRKSLETCLWNEIEDYDQTSGAFGGADKLTSIKKEKGPWILLATNMQGKADLWPHLRTVVKYDGPEK